MNLSIGLSLTRPSNPLGPAAPAFSPLDLFGSGEEGAWYDPSDLSTVWQDAAGTIPATAGDPVGRIDDKSGNGNHATQSTPTARPTLQTSGGLYYLDFDGVDDALLTTFASAQAQPNSVFAGFEYDSASGTYVFDGSPSNRHGLARSGTDIFIFAGSVLLSSTSPANDPAVAGGLFNTTSSVARMNGVDIVSGNAGSNNWGGIVLGSRDTAAASFLDGRIYGYVGVNRTLTAGEIDDVESYLAAKSGVTL
jgi:hypothetical protein